MYKNYLKIGWRNLIKSRVFSFINIFGLSLGLTCSIFIALWVKDEYGIDAFHENDDRIFIVTSCEYSGGEITFGGYDTPGLLGDELKVSIPEVEYSCGYSWTSHHTFAVDDKILKSAGNFAGEDFFKIFSYPLLIGTKETALSSPESISISRKLANSLFGSPELAMDKSVRFENYKDLKVTAVFEDLQDNVSEKFDFIINWDFFVEREGDWIKNWNNSGPTTFAMLREHADQETVRSKIQHFIGKYSKDYSNTNRLELSLQPFREKYLNSNFKNGRVSGGRIEYVRLFSLIAIFILMIAWINFINLCTARATKRGKEISVRKVNGALRATLISQFIVEAFLFTAIAVFLSLLLLFLGLPEFNLLTSKNIAAPFQDGWFWVGVTALLLITGFASGSYPALLLSSFKPIAALKDSLKIGSRSVIFRKGLVMFQFTLSMIFVSGMIVITRQVDFIQNKNLGYQKDNLVYMPLTGSLAENFDVFKNEALKSDGIVDVSYISQRPVQIENSTGGVEWEGKPQDAKPIFKEAAVGTDFLKTMQATILHGRDFSEDYADSANYIINEAALRTMGLQNPIGMRITFWGVRGTIVGVVKDFHFNSLHVPISPLVLRIKEDESWGTALIRIDPLRTKNALAELEVLHKKLNPDSPFTYQFADVEYYALYNSEQVIKELAGYFSFLAILISSLGLLGLMIFTSEQRTKEIGIRKVLGASLLQIVSLLSKDLLKLVTMSIAISIPIAYYFSREWLKGFEYRISLQWWVFVVATLGVLVVALLTISIQAIKSALVKPVNSLKSE